MRSQRRGAARGQPDKFGLGVNVLLTGRASRWAVALLLLALSTTANIWIHTATNGRMPLLPFYPAVAAIGFVSGIGPGLAALTVAECLVAYLWSLPMVLLLLFAVGAGLGLALAVTARHLLLESRRTRALVDSALRSARESEQRFQIALKGSSIIAWACDAQKRYTWVYNPGAGFRVEDFVGRHMGEVIPRAQYTAFADAIDRVLATGRGERLPVALEYGGETLHFVSNIDPVTDESGCVIGLVGASLDTTGLHRAQEAVQRSEKQLRAVTDALPVLVAFVDQNQIYRFNNAAYERWRGMKRSEITHRHVRDVIGESAYQLVLPSLERALHGESIRLETRLDYRGVGERDVSVTYVPQSEGGSITGVVVLVEDISALKQNEASLRQQERRWRTMFDAQPECVAVIAPDGALVDMNPAGLAMIEADSIEQLRGHSIHDLVERSHLPMFRAMHAAAQADRPLAEAQEFDIVGLRGTRRTMEGRAVPLHDEAGEIAAVLSVTRDITERKRSETALHEADQRKDEFLATLAHELRNPMAPIRYAAATLRRGAPDQAVQRAREVIERQAAQMSRLLDDLLDMSRVTRNVIELKRATLDLRDLLGEATAMAKPVLTNLQHRLTISTPPNPLWVHGDGTRLLQVIGNLIDNAAKYTEPGGSIEISLEAVGGHAVMHVKDSGIGLAPDMLPKVFELFAQVHKSINIAKGGLGIGLTVVKRLVELHGGTIAVYSEGLHRGARFTVHLPMARPAQDAISERNEADKVVPLFRFRPHILVVDDNRDAAETLAVMLRSEGFPVAVAFDGDSAMAAFDNTHPTVVLLDMGLPDMNGTDVARHIRRQATGQSVHIIAVTGWGQDEDRERTRAAGVDVHLVKPVDPNDLLRLLGQRLDAPPGAPERQLGH
jgi:PAS domain S-box-containing protein